MIIEMIAQNGYEASKAEKFGASRIELVSAIQEGGLTPSYGTIKQVLKMVSIPVQVMIRPHSYHYFYTDREMEIIREDIHMALDAGAAGIVIGALNEDRTINEPILESVISSFPQVDITFHRAFDEVPSQIEAYQTLAKYHQNVKRILTSGGKSNCLEGKINLRNLVEMANKLNGPKIMPGSGLSPENIQEIHWDVGADQYHFGKAVRVDQTFENGIDEKAVGMIRNALL
ncbi:copper homeostasis protein CutC [Lentibacillus sp. L22]|uniref:copper homeostasis protein CutC n=1 Tax=Lentibacillus sp. L22 TaxID=3163028 RepID=UPI003466F8BF